MKLAAWRREVGSLVAQRPGLNFKNNTSLAKKKTTLNINFQRHILPFKSYIKKKKKHFDSFFAIWQKF
jgi:hypothetical protein